MDPSIIIALLGLAGSLFGGISQAGAQQEASTQTQEQWDEWMKLLQQEPSIGYFPTLTTAQQSMLQQLTGEPGGGLGGILGQFTTAPEPTQDLSEILSRFTTSAAPFDVTVPTDAPAALQEILSRFTDISPEAEQAAIAKMSAPAMTQFQEQILPGIRGKHAQAETMWSSMRAGEEAGAGGTLASQLAAMGETYRMQRRTQALQAVGISEEAQAQRAAQALQEARLEQEIEMQRRAQALQAAQMGAATEAQRRAEALQATQQLQQLLATSMLGYYTWPGGGTTTGEEIVAPPPPLEPPVELPEEPYVEGGEYVFIGYDEYGMPIFGPPPGNGGEGKPPVEPPDIGPSLPPDIPLTEPTQTWSQTLQTGMKKAAEEYRRKRAAKKALEEKLAATKEPYSPVSTYGMGWGY